MGQSFEKPEFVSANVNLREKRGESYPREITRLTQLNPNQLWKELERMHIQTYFTQTFRWRMLLISIILLREPSWTNSPLWLSRPTGVPHGGRLSPTRTSCEQLRTLALRCPLVSGYLFISLKRLHFLSFFYAPFPLPFFCWPCRRFIGRGKLSDKNYVSLIEQHKMSKEYMMQAETFASNLRENLDKVRQTKAFKAYNSTFQFLSAATNVSYDSRSPPTIPQTLIKYQFDQIGLSCSTVSSLTSARPWMWWTKCGE